MQFEIRVRTPAMVSGKREDGSPRVVSWHDPETSQHDLKHAQSEVTSLVGLLDTMPTGQEVIIRRIS
jgi:hypothetical protein